MDIVLNSNDSHNSSLTQTKAPRKLFSARDGQSVCSMELIFNELKLPQLLKSCGFRKLCGVSVPVLFKIMLLSVFAGTRTINGFFSSHLGGTLGFHRDVIYRFAKSPYLNWNALRLKLAKLVCDTLVASNDADQKYTLIADDTIMPREQAKHVEMLSRIHTHKGNSYVPGHVCLALSWSDGKSNIPVSGSLVASSKEKNRYCGVTKDIDGRSHGAIARYNAVQSKNQLLWNMVSKARQAGIKATHIVMDSWFFSDKNFRTFRRMGLHSISMCKENIRFDLSSTPGSKTIDISGLVRRMTSKNHSRKSDYLGSEKLYWHGLKLKVVLVRRRGTASKFIALATTDLSLSGHEIVQLYARRWGIEVEFLSDKQFFGLASECRSCDLDSIISFMHIAFIRYLMVEYGRRCNEDPRTAGGLFMAIKEELHELPFKLALSSLVNSIYVIGERIIGELKLTGDAADKVCNIIDTELNRWFMGTVRYITDCLQLKPLVTRINIDHADLNQL